MISLSIINSFLFLGKLIIGDFNWRKFKMLTQDDLVLTRTFIREKISGDTIKRENITLDTICKIEEALGVELIEVPLISSRQKESDKCFTYSITYKTEIVRGNNTEYVQGECCTDKKLV